MDTARWAQGIGVVKKPSMDGGSSSSSIMSTIRPPPPPSAPATQSQSQSQQLVERRSRPVKEQALHCPRCNSTNTKFCYYNNYSLTQPRYFCKTCRRYWTEGGSLRNVPVGGGSRKNKRHSSSSSAPATSSAKISNTQPPPTMTSSSSLPIQQIKAYQGQDLNLAFPISTGFPGLIGGGGFADSISGGELSAMELLRSTGITARPGLGPLVHMSMAPETGAVYGAAGFGLHDFSSPGAAGYIGNGDNGSVMQEGGGRLLFPFGELKQANVESGNEDGDEQNRDPPIFWSGANLGGGGGSW